MTHSDDTLLSQFFFVRNTFQRMNLKAKSKCFFTFKLNDLADTFLQSDWKVRKGPHLPLNLKILRNKPSQNHFYFNIK